MQHGKNILASSSNPRYFSGFTLIELLLVVVILSIVSGLALPTFMRSYRGAKLRSGARNIVMASRYARSVAVLHGLEVEVVLDSKDNTIYIVSFEGTAQEEDSEPFARDLLTAEEQEGLLCTHLTRKLPDGINIISVESKSEDLNADDGVFTLNYYPNGMCQAYSLELEDDKGNTAFITVDPMSARARVEYK